MYAEKWKLLFVSWVWFLVLDTNCSLIEQKLKWWYFWSQLTRIQQIWNIFYSKCRIQYLVDVYTWNRNKFELQNFLLCVENSHEVRLSEAGDPMGVFKRIFAVFLLGSPTDPVIVYRFWFLLLHREEKDLEREVYKKTCGLKYLRGRGGSQILDGQKAWDSSPIFFYLFSLLSCVNIKYKLPFLVSAGVVPKRLVTCSALNYMLLIYSTLCVEPMQPLLPTCPISCLALFSAN